MPQIHSTKKESLTNIEAMSSTDTLEYEMDFIQFILWGVYIDFTNHHGVMTLREHTKETTVLRLSEAIILGSQSQ